VIALLLAVLLMFKIITKIKEGCCSFPSAAPAHMKADMEAHTRGHGRCFHLRWLIWRRKHRRRGDLLPPQWSRITPLIRCTRHHLHTSHQISGIRGNLCPYISPLLTSFYGIAQCIRTGHEWSSLYACVDMFFFNKFDWQFLFSCTFSLTFVFVAATMLFMAEESPDQQYSPSLSSDQQYSSPSLSLQPFTTIGSEILFTVVLHLVFHRNCLIQMTLLMQMALCKVNIWCP